MQNTPPRSTGNSACRCDDPLLAQIVRAVEDDEIDRAIDLGLLGFTAELPTCEACATRIATIFAARDARMRALAARERHRARQARLAERAQARARRRQPAAATASALPSVSAAEKPALPPAAAAALARAKAKAAAKRGD